MHQRLAERFLFPDFFKRFAHQSTNEMTLGTQDTLWIHAVLLHSGSNYDPDKH